MPSPPRLSRELTLLAAVDLASDASLGKLIDEAGQPGFDWLRFAELATCHGMAAIAGARLVQVGGDAVPERVALPLRTALRDSAASMIAQTAESARLSAMFGDAGIRSIVLKGAALAHLLYASHPEWRRSTDIDLLIDLADLTEADRRLVQAGYQRTWPEGDLPRRGLDMLLHLANVFTYVSPATGLLIELHHRISLNPYWLPASFDDLFAQTAEIATDSGPVRGLDGPLHVSYLAWHALGHSGYRLKWFCDIVRALRRAGESSCADYLANVPQQTSQRPLDAVDQVIAAIASALGEVPPAQSGTHAAQRIVTDLERASAIRTGRNLATLFAEAAELTRLVRLSPPGNGRRYQVMRSLSDPRDVYRLGLSRRFTPVYAAAGPFLAFGRLLGRRIEEAG